MNAGSDPNQGEHIRVIARSVLANLESLLAEGLAVADLEAVTAICRTLNASAVDHASRGVLVRQLRERLGSTRGLTGSTFVGWIDDIEAAAR